MKLEVPKKIIEKYNITLFIIFGSSGTEYEREDSDLDLAFLSENLISEEKEYNLLQELNNFYKRGDIDLVNLRKGNPILKLNISREGRVIFERDNEFDKFQLYAAHLYADTKFIRKEREKVLEERVNKL